MAYAFLLLMLTSIGCLITGLIKPSVFDRFFKKSLSRKQLTLIFLGSTIVFFILTAVTVPSIDKKANTNQAQTDTNNESNVDEKKTDAGTNTATGQETKTETPTIPEVTYKDASNYKKGDQTWRLIVFSRKPSDDELIKVAKELHSQNKTDYYSFFDDDEKLEEFKNWDINYAITPDENAFPYPKEWAEAHELAIMNELYSNGIMKWQLTSMLTFEKLSDF